MVFYRLLKLRFEQRKPVVQGQRIFAVLSNYFLADLASTDHL